MRGLGARPCLLIIAHRSRCLNLWKHRARGWHEVIWHTLSFKLSLPLFKLIHNVPSRRHLVVIKIFCRLIKSHKLSFTEIKFGNVALFSSDRSLLSCGGIKHQTLAYGLDFNDAHSPWLLLHSGSSSPIRGWGFWRPWTLLKQLGVPLLLYFLGQR